MANGDWVSCYLAYHLLDLAWTPQRQGEHYITELSSSPNDLGVQGNKFSWTVHIPQCCSSADVTQSLQSISVHADPLRLSSDLDNLLNLSARVRQSANDQESVQQIQRHSMWRDYVLGSSTEHNTCINIAHGLTLCSRMVLYVNVIHISLKVFLIYPSCF